MKFLDEKFVRRSVINWLGRKGYSRNLREKETKEHGVDIKVRHYRYARYYLVEIKGGPNPKTVKQPASRREVSFLIALGQIVSRMRYKAKYKYAIGMPYTYSDKIYKRLPWLICKKLRLAVLIVDKQGKVKNITWKDLKNHQEGY